MVEKKEVKEEKEKKEVKGKERKDVEKKKETKKEEEREEKKEKEEGRKEAKTEKKREKEKETKEEKKVEKVEEKKEKGVKEKEHRKEKVKYEKLYSPKEVKQLREKIKKKRKVEVRGRFGKPFTRRKSKKKWAKWRFPRGCDIKFERECGPMPNAGRGNAREIRKLHPSGYKEILIHNVNDLQYADKFTACRIASTIGERKRQEIIRKANELKVKILNA